MMESDFFRRWNGAIIPVIFLIAAFLRLAALDADPPSTVGLHFLSDEGWWVHNARNKVLYDDWIMDEFNQSLLASPTFCLSTYGVYSLFGVSYGTSRIIPALSGLLTVLLFSGILYKHSPPATVVLATFLFGCNFAFSAMNRTAYVDSTALMFLVLSWWLFERLPHRVWAVFLSGMSFALAVATKSYVLSICPAAGIILAGRLYAYRRKGMKSATIILNSILFIGGLVAVYLLWRKYLYNPFSHEYRIMYSLWQDGNFPDSLRQALRNIPSFFIGHHGNHLIPARFFGLNATLLLLAGFRLFRLLDPAFGSLKTAWKKAPTIDKECVIFFIVLALQIAPMTAKPFRRYLLLYIPLIILASRSILAIDFPSAVPAAGIFLKSLRRLILPILGILLGSPFLIRVIPANHLPQSASWIIVSLLLAAMLFPVPRLIKSTRLTDKFGIPLVLILCLAIDGTLFLHSYLTRSYTLRDTSRRLGVEYLKPGTLILGGIGGSLCLENQARSIAIWGREEASRVFNEDPIRRFSPDYVIILRKLDGIEWAREQRYDRYALQENFIENIQLLPDGDSFRVEAELFRAPLREPADSAYPRITI